MKITDVALKRPVTVTICTVALLVFGLMALSSMVMSELPDVDIPVIVIRTIMRGANATVVDNDVTDVIEENVSTVSGIDSISSSSYDGLGVTVVMFDLDTDVNAAAADIRDKINAAAADLPDEAEMPVVAKYDMGDSPLVIAAITGDAPYKEKVEFVDKIAKARIQSVSGVGSVNTPGLREREIRIWLDPVKLQSRGLTAVDISNAIKDKHIELPAGSIEDARTKYELRLLGEYATVEELSSLPVAVREGRIVRLRDVAAVEDGIKEQDSIALYKDGRSIFLEVLKQRGANEVQVSEASVARINELKTQLPAGMNIDVLYNRADFVKRSMKGVAQDVMQAVILCSIIMLFFLQTFRATFVTVITIPVCLVGAFSFINMFGIGINNLSMMGISLAVGMVVDATSVVLENIYRHLEAGDAPMLAASVGAGEVGFSVLAGAATTIAVFAPIAFMGGIVGRFFYSFGITIVATIALSLILSLTLTPFACSKLLRINKRGPIASFVDGIITGVNTAYKNALAMALRFRWVTLGVALSMFVMGMFFAGIVGKGFFPTSDEGEFNISLELPSGTSLEETERTMRTIDGVIRKNPHVSFTYGNIGGGSSGEVNKGTLYVTLIGRKARPDISVVMSQVRRDISVFKDVKATLAIWGGKDVSMILQGGSPKELLDISGKVFAELEKDGRLVDMDTDVRLNKPQLALELNRGLTDDMNINIKDLSMEIQAYFGGLKSGVFKDGGYRYDIRLMADKSLRDSPSDIDKISVKNGHGKIVTVPGMVTTKQIFGPSVVKRYNRQGSLTISANTEEGFSTGEAIVLLTQIAQKHFPQGKNFAIVPSGNSKSQTEDFKRLFVALIIAIILVYMVMAIQFESFLHPFTVMFSLPLLTPGAFGMLLLAGNNLDMMSFIGIILLVGIVVNNAIILVDFINQEREKGLNRIEAVLKVGPMRFRAILITAMSTMVGSIPMALKLSEGSEFRQPMAVAVVGGLLTSTLLTLFVIPIIYVFMDDLRENTGKLLRWLGIGKRKAAVL